MWSPPVKVNDNLERQRLEHRNVGILPLKSGDVFVGWQQRTKEKSSVFFAKRITRPDSIRIERKPLITLKPEKETFKINFEIEKVIFSDNFESGVSQIWREVAGTWVWKEQMYIGYDRAKSYLDTQPLFNFKFSGQFKLDPLNHQSAFILFRMNEKPGDNTSYYQIMNFFRLGVTLEYFNGMSYTQIANAPFPFQEDEWYLFHVVLKENCLNYYINDSLILAIENLNNNVAGTLGIGTHNAPAYFKNFSVSMIK